LQDFVIAVPDVSTNARNSKFVLLVRGTFDESRIRASAKAKGAIAQKYQGTDLFMGAHDQRDNAFAFLGGNLAVMGDIATVQRIIANRANPAPLNTTLSRLVSNVGPNNDMWFVSIMPGPYLANQVKEQANQPLPAQ